MTGDVYRQSPFLSGAFRFAMLFAAVFALTSVLLLIVVEQQVARYAQEATDGTLRSEVKILSGEYSAMGLPGLTDAIARHQRSGGQAQFRYLLTDRGGRRLAGDLPAFAARPGWQQVDIRDMAGPRVFKTLGQQLPDGLNLVVAADTAAVRQLKMRLVRFTLWSGLAITVLALLGGYFVGGVFLRRLERVNDAVGRIMSGTLTERLPAIGMSPEFDHLSQNLNLMLDRITTLMDGVRQVSTDIAHDLRTPLTRLRQHLEETRGATSAAAREDGIDAAIDQTEEMLVIFRALLRIGTLESGAGRQRFGEVDLSEVMERVAQAYQPVAEDAGKTLVADHAAGVFVRGDGELLAQMLTNLIENALTHTPDGTVITSRLTAGGGTIVAQVADTGPGVPEAERTRIFQRFYRLDPSRNSSGAGLGLALVSAIATLHEADVAVEDSHPGPNPGLTVSVRFKG